MRKIWRNRQQITARMLVLCLLVSLVSQPCYANTQGVGGGVSVSGGQVSEDTSQSDQQAPPETWEGSQDGSEDSEDTGTEQEDGQDSQDGSEDSQEDAGSGQEDSGQKPGDAGQKPGDVGTEQGSGQEGGQVDAGQSTIEVYSGGSGTMDLEIQFPSNESGNSYLATIDVLYYDEYNVLTPIVDRTFSRDIQVGSETRNVDYSVQHELIYDENNYYKEAIYLGHVVILSDIPSGATIKIEDLESVGNSSSSNAISKIEYRIAALESTSHTPVEFSDTKSGTYSAYPSLEFTEAGSKTWYSQLTTSLAQDPSKTESRTFSTIMKDDFGQNTVDTAFFLNYYNVFSFSNIEAIHIIGTVIANGTVGKANFGTGSTDVGVISIADYSRGYPSYVNEVKTVVSDVHSASIKLEYGYDKDEDETFAVSDVPMLYIDKDKHYIYDLSTSAYVTGEFVLHRDSNLGFKSPNYSGALEKVQAVDSSFLDWTGLKSMFDSTSSQLSRTGLLTSGSTSITTLDLADSNIYETITYKGTQVSVLRLEHGTCYKFISSNGNSLLETVLLDYGTDFTYGTTADNNPTTVNITAGSLPTVTSDGVTYDVFPNIFIRDRKHTDEPLTVDRGKGSEYNDIGNKVLWNFESSSNIVFSGAGANIIGHILAPNSTIYNYKTTKDQGNWVLDKNEWSGGNINGTIIAKEIFLGNMEMHYWPYQTDTELDIIKSSASLTLAGTKTTNTGYYLDGFSFQLKETTASSNVTMPNTTTVSSDEYGAFSFDQIYFKDEGTYTFTIEEVENVSKYHLLGFSYDKSVYTFEVRVDSDTVTDGDSETTSYYVSKVVITQEKESVSSTIATLTSSGSTEISTGSSVKFYNTYTVTELPETGGMGTTIYSIFGISVMAMAILRYNKTNFKKVREKQ